MNKLQGELSPYLNQWASDGVDWYPWGREAFARAAAEHKPMRISMGTTACGGPVGSAATVARLTERYFIPVKVDSGEHPDVAAVYTRAAAMLTGRGPGPLEILTDSGGTPFFAAGAVGQVELAGLLSGVALHWSSDPTPYERAAAALCRQLLEAEQPPSTAAEPLQLCEAMLERLGDAFDEENGGFGGGERGLHSGALLFLLAYARYTGEPQPLNMAAYTLERMALSGVRDQIGGGFFRGARDPRGLQPIPEKRLMDQAWMLDAYTRAWQLTGTELFRRVAVETADFVIRELRHGAGGFYTAQWSEDGFYLLSAPFVHQALGDNDGAVFCRQYAIGDTPAAASLLWGEDAAEDTVLLHDLRMKLYRARLQRGAPQRDDKVLTGCNGVMIAALARAGRVLGVERYLTAAAAAEEFLRSRLVTCTDLRRYWCHGAVAGDGALEDYGGYALGLFELYRCGCGGEYLRHAARVMARGDALFSDHDGGGWFLTRAQGPLPLRPKQLWDDGAPSAGSMGLMALARLSRELQHPGLRSRTRTLMGEAARREPDPYTLTAMLELL